MGISLKGFGEGGPAHAQRAEPIAIREDLRRSAIGEDGSVEENDPVGMGGGIFDVVGDQENGEIVGSTQIANEIIEEKEPRLIDSGDRFIEQEDVRKRRHRQGQEDALEFTAGECAQASAREMLGSHGAQGFFDHQTLGEGDKGMLRDTKKVRHRDGGVGIDG